MTHTPGPWKLWGGEFCAYEVRVETGEMVAGGMSCEADARLISAAPDLLAALTELRAAAKNGASLEPFYDREIDALWDAADAALTKATGDGP